MLKQISRPVPPGVFLNEFRSYIGLIPVEDVTEWVNEIILSRDGYLYNPDHEHLIDGDVRFMWASVDFTKKGRTVLGQA